MTGDTPSYGKGKRAQVGLISGDGDISVLGSYKNAAANAAPLISQHGKLHLYDLMNFDADSKLVDRPLLRMSANEPYEAVSRGPSSIERSAWWMGCPYSKPANKVRY